MSYSDAGQEQWILKQFPEGFTGVAVEVGANDGVTLSNTAILEEKGWKCLLIEPMGDHYRACSLNRPSSVVVHAACGPEAKPETKLILDATCATRSTIYPELANWISEQCQEEVVQVKTVDQCIEESGLGQCDVLIVDVDGPELDVLAGFDFARWRPKALVIEDDVFRYDGETYDQRRQAICDLGYQLDKVMNNDGGYVRL